MYEYDRWWVLGTNFEGIQSVQVRPGGLHASRCHHQHQYDKSLSVYETLRCHFCSSKTRDRGPLNLPVFLRKKSQLPLTPYVALHAYLLSTIPVELPLPVHLIASGTLYERTEASYKNNEAVQPPNWPPARPEKIHKQHNPDAFGVVVHFVL